MAGLLFSQSKYTPDCILVQCYTYLKKLYAIATGQEKVITVNDNLILQFVVIIVHIS